MKHILVATIAAVVLVGCGPPEAEQDNFLPVPLGKMKNKLNLSTVVLALFGFIAVQTATAQAPNPHPAHEASKGLQPFIGNWAVEFDSEGGFEGLDNSGRTASGTQKVRWFLNKTAFGLPKLLWYSVLFRDTWFPNIERLCLINLKEHLH
jgi:hypothetical protein